MRIKSTLLFLLACAFLLSACVIDEEESYSNTYPNYSQQTHVYQNNGTYQRTQQTRVYNNNQGGYRTSSTTTQTKVHVPVNAYRSNNPMAEQTPSYQSQPRVKVVQNDANSQSVTTQSTQTYSNKPQETGNGGVSLH